ncbi:MAG: hypothetical protein KGS09_16580 [Nitrospirae bacterium]|nr:hypothetical protein [Nitrospirota bacterium]
MGEPDHRSEGAVKRKVLRSTDANSGTTVVGDYADMMRLKFTCVLKKVVIEPGKCGLAAGDDKKLAGGGITLGCLKS